MVAITYGPHAADMLQERDIDPRWVERTVTAPEMVEQEPRHPARTRAFRTIPERDGRMLRVVYEQVGEEAVRIITVFFDRGRRRRL